MQHKFDLMDWVQTTEDSGIIIPGKFAQIINRQDEQFLVFNQYFRNPLWVPQVDLLPFEYIPSHKVFLVNFQFKYLEGQSLKKDGEHFVEIPDLRDDQAPVAFIETTINPIYYRVWAGKLWTSVAFSKEMRKDPVQLKSNFSQTETSEMFVGIKSQDATKSAIDTWANQIICVEGKIYTIVPGEPRILVREPLAPVQGIKCNLIHVERVFEYEPKHMFMQYFRLDDTEGLNQYLREQQEILEASTGEEYGISFHEKYEFILCGCLRLRPDIDHADRQEQCYQELYKKFVEITEKHFLGDRTNIKRALRTYLDAD